jgi:glycosyltransferase involved in cell wall biosynthesis|tara:strand:+ start:1380 stop:2090 length:711 start_codon:yes stop_codon:yes gene_type:complete
MKISIAIPTWECHGRGSEFINDLLRTIQIQSYKDFEVCISDHSQDDEVLKEVKQFQDKFKIVYSKNEDDRGNGPANTNKAIEMCSGDIIKVMFQDDFFYDTESLEKIHSEFEQSDSMWLVNGCNHTKDDGYNFFWEMFPRWNDKILEGKNTISSPSVLSIKRECFDKVKFDKNLVMMMDCDYYYNLRENFGDPIILDDVLITNRIHQNQISSTYDNNNLELECDYCIAKHTDLIRS